MKALVPIANGSEEMEAVIIIDTLRRAEWKVTVVGLEEGAVEASRGVKFVPDTTWDEIDPNEYDALILPGGFGGTMAFSEHLGILKALQEFDKKGKWIGSICAAALALQAAGILRGKKFTCYPGVVDKLPEGLEYRGEHVVVDGHLITSQGPGTAFDFALKFIEECTSPSAAASVRRGLLL